MPNHEKKTESQAPINPPVVTRLRAIKQMKAENVIALELLSMKLSLLN